MIVGNVCEDVTDVPLQELETSRLRVILARLYRSLLLQTKIRIKENNPWGRNVVCSYGPGYRRIKYNIAIATQIGCKVRCKEICSVPSYKRDLTPDEISDEISLLVRTVEAAGLKTHNNLKISMVKEGEPLLNKNFQGILEMIAERHPYSLKVSTTFPKSEVSSRNIENLIAFASRYDPPVQLQISLGSSDAQCRKTLTVHPTNSFEAVKEIGHEWKQRIPDARKINLSFTLYEETPCDPEAIIKVLSPEYFAIRLRDALVNDNQPDQRNPISDHRYEFIKERFKSFGYMVIEGRPGDIERDFNLATGQYRFVEES